MNIKSYNIIIADTQFLITESLKILIQNRSTYNLTGLAENYQELKSMLASNNADLLITDFAMFNYEYFEDLKQIKTGFPNLQILILTNHINRNEINELTRIGIKNIIYKSTDTEELFMAMNLAVRHKKYYSDEVMEVLMDNVSANSPDEHCHLTPSEIDIVKLVATGMTNKEIAEKKHVSFHTIITHRKNIFRKLKINNVSELLIYAVRAGLVDNIEYYI